MLESVIGLFGGSSIGSGQHTVDVFYQDGSQAIFTRVGDTIRDSLDNEYEVLTWAGFPNDFISGTQMTLQFITVDAPPSNSSGFDSAIFTPGQIDVRPAVQTSGTIGGISNFSGQNFEYELSASWDDAASAANAIVGDSVVDSTGKEYIITFLTSNLFADPFRVAEVEQEGIPPVGGEATLYRSTLNFDFFQGTELTDSARTTIFNRDKFLIDSLLTNSGDSGAGSLIQSEFDNGSGGTFSIGTPVRVDSSNQLQPVDVSEESHILALAGVAAENITTSGNVAHKGRLEQISTALPVATTAYISKLGGITVALPSIGVDGFVAGDFVVKVGTVIENRLDSSQRDLLVDLDVIGQL